MKYTTKTPKPWKKVLEISVPGSRVSLEIDRLSDYYSKRTKIDGFRAGRVPPQLVKAKHFTKLQEEAMDKIIQNSYKEVLEKSSLSPITHAKISNVSFSFKKNLSFKATFEIIPDIEIKHYKNIECVRKVRTVTKTDVDKELERLRHSLPVLEPVNRRIKTTDAVVVDLKVYHGPQLVKEVAESTIFVNNLLKEVQKKIVGKTAGYKVSLKENDRVTQILVREVKEPLYPEIDDNLAKNLKFENLKSLKKKVRENLKNAEDSNSEREVQEEITNKLIAENPFDPPSSLIEIQLNEMCGQAQEKEKYRSQALHLVKRRIILDKIASLEKLSVTEKELDEEVEKLAKSEDVSPERLRTELTTSGRNDVLSNRVKYDKVLRFLVNQSSVKTEKVKE